METPKVLFKGWGASFQETAPGTLQWGVMSDPNSLYLVYTTVEDVPQARHLAKGLVESRLVACAQIQPKCESVFPWDGEIQSASEVGLTLKTTQRCWPSVKAWLDEHHPYEVPEVLAVPVSDGSAAYMAWARGWLADGTNDPSLRGGTP